MLEDRKFFVGVGAMKSGTSWLSDYLKSHPEVYHSPIKELNFFNQLSPNRLKFEPSVFRMERVAKILLDKEPNYPPSKYSYRKLQELADLTRITDIDSYRQYFANRIGSEKAFGEISPNYSALNESGLRNMLEVNGDARIFFVMRDPTERVCSHIRHLWRKRPGLDINEIINDLDKGNNIYFRSDYGDTIDNLYKAFDKQRVMLIFYEKLFDEETISSICDFLTVSYSNPNTNKRVNISKTPDIEDCYKIQIKEKLSSIYVDMKERFGKELPEYWTR